MPPIRLPRLPCLVLCAIAILPLWGCGSSSYSSTRGTTNGTDAGGAGDTGNTGMGNPAPVGGQRHLRSLNSVMATSSVGGTVSVVTGANQTVSISFNSSDGLAISGFGMSGIWAPSPRVGPVREVLAVRRSKEAAAACSISPMRRRQPAAAS